MGGNFVYEILYLIEGLDTRRYAAGTAV